MDKKAIIIKISNIAKASQRVTAAVQETAVACAIHAVRHGDVTLADKLVDAIGKGMRRASLRAWFEVNTCMYLPKGKDTFAFDSLRADKLKEMTDAELEETFNAVNWEEAKPEEKAVSVIDVGDAFDKFLKRIEKQAAEATVEVKHKDLLDKLRAATREYHAAAAIK